MLYQVNKIMKNPSAEDQKYQALKNNLERYARLLATKLTQTEREYIHRRIAAEHAVLLGDSILDNWACVPGKPAVIDQMRG